MALDHSSVAPELREFLARNFLFTDQGLSCGDDASLLAEGVIDSLGIIEVVAFVEKRFAIKVADQELLPDNFDSVNKLTAFITRKLSA
jgi:acyl carrier protein